MVRVLNGRAELYNETIREYGTRGLPESALRTVTHKTSHLEGTVQLNPRSELSPPEFRVGCSEICSAELSL